MLNALRNNNLQFDGRSSIFFPARMTKSTFRTKSMSVVMLVFVALASASRAQVADSPAVPNVLRVGMIGLDTSHAPVFTKIINQEESYPYRGRIQVTAAFPGGSPDLQSSWSRVEGYTRDLASMGVEIVDSIEELLKRVDAVMLESVDGRPHLDQVCPVFRAGKPVFIDKPLAGSLADAIAIQRLADRYQVKWFSSSSLRFSPSVIQFREQEKFRGKVRGAITYGPCPLEPTHPDLFWYGIHGVEMLYTIMGRGCVQVNRTYTEGADVVVGLWEDGRAGVFRGIRAGKSDYGGVVFLDDQIVSELKYTGYEPLLASIGAFFVEGQLPIDPQETIELFAFMEAAQRSREHGGQAVSIQQVMDQATLLADQRVAKLEGSK